MAFVRDPPLVEPRLLVQPPTVRDDQLPGITIAHFKATNGIEWVTV